jgi:uroporphyrinogen decarboxylase
MLTPRQRFTAALERRPLPGRVPHFELNYYLTMEVFGKVHPQHRSYHQWLQMSETEKRAHRMDMARIYIEIAERFDHDAIRMVPNPNDLDEEMRQIDAVRDLCGDRYFIMLHGDCTFGIPNGQGMEDLSLRMSEEPESVLKEAEESLGKWASRAQRLQKHGGLDGFTLCSDYCFNSGSFLSLEWFDRFIMPFLTRIIQAYRQLGFYTIKHTDGNIMPILDRLVAARPHALHSLDPQGGVDIAEVVRRAGDNVALCGNVNCGLLQTGTDQECVASARYAIREGMKAPGYIFCTSNCVYTGMDVRRYDLIHDIWKREAIRQ